MPDPTTATLFRPVLIETVEQAERLPEGTLAHGHWPDRQYGYGLVEKIGGAWVPKSVSGVGLAPPEALIGWTALVPVTATIERMFAYAVMPDPERGPTLPPETKATRYTTPWTPEEEA